MFDIDFMWVQYKLIVMTISCTVHQFQFQVGTGATVTHFRFIFIIVPLQVGMHTISILIFGSNSTLHRSVDTTS